MPNRSMALSRAGDDVCDKLSKISRMKCLRRNATERGDADGERFALSVGYAENQLLAADERDTHFSSVRCVRGAENGGLGRLQLRNE